MMMTSAPSQLPRHLLQAECAPNARYPYQHMTTETQLWHNLGLLAVILRHDNQLIDSRFTF